jgi:hypothetical protein
MLELHILSLGASFNMGFSSPGVTVNVLIGGALWDRYGTDTKSMGDSDPELVEEVRLSVEELEAYTVLADAKHALVLAESAAASLLRPRMQ